MRILMLTPYLPYPPSSGGQVRSYNLIKNLAKKHQITLFSLIKNDQEKEYVKELEKYCQKVMIFKRSDSPWKLGNILKTGFGLYPFLVVRNMSEEEKVALEKELRKEKYDLIHAETFYVMPHLPETKTPILLVDQTIEFQVYQHYVNEIPPFFLKPFLYLDVLKIKYWEIRFWRRANKVIAVSEADRKKMLSLVGDLDVGVVPNGPGEDLMAVWKSRAPEPATILFQANFSWLQNIEAAQILARKVYPLIKRKLPDSVCFIVGQGARDKVGDLVKEGVKIVDLKNSDIEGVVDAYRRATVFVAPLRGPGGTRLKILGAMAAGVPIVTTKVGIEGIDAHDQEEVLVADDWRKMAEKAVSLINDKKLSSGLTRSARELVEKQYSYQKIALILDKLYQEVASVKG